MLEIGAAQGQQRDYWDGRPAAEDGLLLGRRYKWLLGTCGRPGLCRILKARDPLGDRTLAANCMASTPPAPHALCRVSMFWVPITNLPRRCPCADVRLANLTVCNQRQRITFSGIPSGAYGDTMI